MMNLKPGMTKSDGVFGVFSLIFLSISSVFAAATDIANGPLANGVSSATSVKPNIAFYVDDSGSMDNENMPDGDDTNKDKECWGWYGYNTLAYNPTVTYKPPFKIDGDAYTDGVKRYPDASFTAALKDGYFSAGGYTYGGSSTSNTTTNLSTVSNLTTTASTKYYYAYPSNASDNSTTACLGDSKYTTVTSSANIVAPGQTAGSDGAKRNYANWYSYYRKRAYVMKAAAAEAFRTVEDNKYRIGLFYINSIQSGAGKKNNDLRIDDFTGSHRTAWFDGLLFARKDGGTPNRGALSRAGRMFAGQLKSVTVGTETLNFDPVQYSCQQNFTILSTDGYWNDIGETSTYGPKNITGSADVGNVDGGAASSSGSGASATIDFGSWSGSGSNRCYYVESLVAGSTSIITGRAPGTGCETSRGNLASAIQAKLISGFTATYESNNDILTITAPISAGDLIDTLSMDLRTDSTSGKTLSFTTTAFSGYVAGSSVAGAVLPYRDDLNVSNTLADIAYYYYTNDLRTSSLDNCSNTIGSTTYSNLCDNNVLGSGKDSNQQQHMTTFTIGLGVNGTLKYESNYENAAKDSDNSTTQYYDIANGTASWPDPFSSTSQSAKRIDDLWHAAVNGRGTYYSAATANQLAAGINSALSGVVARTGSSAAAATSNLEPVAGDNFVFVALYRTQYWDGDVKAYTIDPDSGVLSISSLWSAQSKLDQTLAAASAGADGRTIKYFSTGTGNVNNLKDFTITSLTADSKSDLFANRCTGSSVLSQCGSGSALSAAQKTLADSGDNMVKYLRGQATYEAVTGATNPLYRDREHVLGDIINAVPVYLKKPPFAYDKFDTTYSTFKSDNASRAATVFVAANDGMLHAINATDGVERWAYVPSFVLPNLYKLADTNYSSNHLYSVDGSPSVADICTSLSSTNLALCAAASNWKTILVAGLNKGGCGYYALDVTDPTSPKGLWEFSNENLGYSYGNPVVTKRKDGKWVVIFASGYNNVPGTCASSTSNSDGNGHVFVVDAATGELLEDIPTYSTGTTKIGSATTPSGLAKLNAWVEDETTNVTKRVYGGDLLGNLWRIDFDDNYVPDGKEAVRLAEFHLDSGGSTYYQPISTKPELGEVTYGGVKYPVVMVGTGRYLGTSDTSDTHQQSVYAIKDKLEDSGHGDVRADSDFVSRALAETTVDGKKIRTVSGSDLNWASMDGWYFDLNPSNLSPTERVNVDMQIQYNILTVAANVPETNVCNVGGYAWLYFVDMDTGKNLSTAANSMLGVRLSNNALVAGIKTVKLSNGKTVTIITDSSGGITVESNPSATGSAAGAARRTMWREILD